MKKRAVVTGITGQDGAYLAELLLSKGYTVYGTYRRTSSVNFWRIEELGIQDHPDLHLVEYDLTDLGSSLRLLKEIEPDEVYNLAAQSFVGVSFDQPDDHGADHRHGRVAPARGDPPDQSEDPLLPGLHLRDVRQGAGHPAGRRHALLSAQPLRRGQAVRALDDHQLPRELRHLRLQRHPVQPRKPAARPRVRHPQDHRRAWPRSSWASSTCWSWATWTPSATGASPRSMSKACG